MRTLTYPEIQQLFSDRVVRHGPFEGLCYPEFASVGSALYPKLLGSYESEIHDWIETVCTAGYSEILDVGCAEGYYAVGLARRLAEAVVYAYDIDPEARRLCSSMAEANRVHDRVHVRGAFAGNDIAQIPLRHRGLVVCDCEGGEMSIFTEDTVKLFAGWDLLIETHDFIDISFSTRLAQLFSATHNLTVAESMDDIQKAKTYRYPELTDLDLPTRRSILGEYRPTIMEWFFLTSKQSAASRHHPSE